MRKKYDVELTGITFEMQLANHKAAELWRLLGRELVITSGLDGVHMKNSKHYDGNACDYRTRYFDKAAIPTIAATLRLVLGDDYDVVVESTHIHVEYDPNL